MRILILLLITFSANHSIWAQEYLFNGENLDGWNIHGTELWYVEHGILICESGPRQNIMMILNYLLNLNKKPMETVAFLFDQLLMELKLMDGKLKLPLLEMIQVEFMSLMEEAG